MASASPRETISELNLHGLLPHCVRFAPTSRPVNGNTRYRPACSLWPGGTYTRWIPLRSFTVSSSVPPLPRFSQRDNNTGSVKSFFLSFHSFFLFLCTLFRTPLHSLLRVVLLVFFDSASTTTARL